MTQEQLLSLALARHIGPALFVCEHIEKKCGRRRLHPDDLQALGDDDRTAIEEAMPLAFMMRVADRLDARAHNHLAEMLGPEAMASVYEMIARVLHNEAKRRAL